MKYLHYLLTVLVISTHIVYVYAGGDTALAPSSTFSSEKKEDLFHDRVAEIFKELRIDREGAMLSANRFKTFAALRSVGKLPEPFVKAVEGKPAVMETVLRLRPATLISVSTPEEMNTLIDGIDRIRYASPSDIATIRVSKTAFLVYNEGPMAALFEKAGGSLNKEAMAAKLSAWIDGNLTEPAPAQERILAPAAHAGTLTLWNMFNARPELVKGWETPNRFNTIAIPTRNRPGTIRKTLAALIDNLTLWGHTDVEILIIDDSSADEYINGNKQAIKDLSEKGVRIRYMGRREFDRFVDHLSAGIADALKKPYRSVDTSFLKKQFTPHSPQAKDRVAESLRDSVFPSQIGGKRNLILSVLIGKRFIMSDDDALPVARFVPAGAIDESERMETDTKEISTEFADTLTDEVPVDIIEGVNRCMGKGEYFCNFRILHDDDWSVKTFVKHFLSQTDNDHLFGTMKTGAIPFKRLALRPDLSKGRLGEAPVTTTYVGVDNTESVVLPYPVEWLEDELIGIFRDAVFGKGTAAFTGLGSVHERSVESSSRNIPRNLFFETLHSILIDITKEMFSDIALANAQKGISLDQFTPEIIRTITLRDLAGRNLSFSQVVWASNAMMESHKKWLPHTVRKYMCEDPIAYQGAALDAADMLLDEGRIEDARACYEFAQGLARFFRLREDEREAQPEGYLEKLADTIMEKEIVPRLAAIAESLVVGNLAIGELEKETDIVERFTVPADQLALTPVSEGTPQPSATLERRISFERYLKKFNERAGRPELNQNARKQEIPVAAPVDTAS